MKASAPYNHHGSRDSGPPPSTVSEAEFEEIMKRNRAISSSAISKAVSGASAGRDTGPESGRLAGPGRAVGGTGTCFITKSGMMITSKKGTGSTRDTGIENGTGTTEKGGTKPRSWLWAIFYKRKSTDREDSALSF